MKNEKDIFDFIKSVKTEEPSAEYFNNLADKIIADNKTKVIPLHKKPFFWLSSAAAIAIVLFSVIKFNNATEIESPTLLAFNEVDNVEIFQYIDENIEEFDTELIAELIPESKLEVTKSVQPDTGTEEIQESSSVVSLDEITNEEILEYLNDEEIELSDLEEDLFI
ncbi:MAG: hypothetical protein ACPGVI_04890 [Crocinitomicaceae bacterium]